MTLAIDSTSYISPNHSSRQGRAISILVVHATVGSAASALSWLCNPTSKVSTHYLIDKSGKIYQLVPDIFSAWHAGKSRWRGLTATDIALGSLGIELENANTGHDPYPPAQLNSLLELSRSLVVKYSILSDMTVRHLDIATPKGRKSDPAGFPWEQFMSALYVPKNTSSSWRVRLDTQIGATVRAHPQRTAERLMSVPAGTLLHGRITTGESITLAGFGTSDQWLALDNGGFIWLPLLENIS
jgi:N-acetyl-anhydromuramyl-L-alanine amidase AmpD